MTRRKLRNRFRAIKDNAPPPVPPAGDDASGDPSPEAGRAPRAAEEEQQPPASAQRPRADHAREHYLPVESREQEYLRRLALAAISEAQLTAEGLSGEFSSLEARLIWRDFGDLALERVATEARIAERDRNAGDFEAGG